LNLQNKTEKFSKKNSFIFANSTKHHGRLLFSVVLFYIITFIGKKFANNKNNALFCGIMVDNPFHSFY